MGKIIYVILNNKLKMSPGKAAAQTAHAVIMLNAQHRESFGKDYRRTVVVLGASGREQMDGIIDYVASADLDFEYYIDEGINEVEAFSMTAIAVQPIDEDDEKTRAIFEELPLYKGSFESSQDSAIINLTRVIAKRTRMGLFVEDNTPRYVKKTLKWLAENK